MIYKVHIQSRMQIESILEEGERPLFLQVLESNKEWRAPEVRRCWLANTNDLAQVKFQP